MLPTTLSDDGPNSTLAYTVFTAQSLLADAAALVPSPNLCNSDLAQLGDPIAAASSKRFGMQPRSARIPASIAPFANLVGHILSRCSNEKMVRADATGIVAPVADEHISGDGAEVQLIRDPMSQEHAACPATSGDVSIAVLITESCPCPASLRPLDFGPKALNQGLPRNWTAATTRHRAVVSRARSRREEHSAATGTSDRGPGRLRMHRKFTPFGATPPDVCSIAGALCCPNYTRGA